MTHNCGAGGLSPCVDVPFPLGAPSREVERPRAQVPEKKRGGTDGPRVPFHGRISQQCPSAFPDWGWN